MEARGGIFTHIGGCYWLLGRSVLVDTPIHGFSKWSDFLMYGSLRIVGLLILQLRAPRASVPRELEGNYMVFSDSASEAM